MNDPSMISGNPLLLPLGPIPHDETLIVDLTKIPAAFNAKVEHYLRPYEIDKVLDLVVPTDEMIRGARIIDRMMRHSLSVRDPAQASTERSLYALHGHGSSLTDILGGAGLISGMSGVGKTVLSKRALARYPIFYDHESFPGRSKPVRQLVWLHLVVPSAATMWRLADALVKATSAALGDETIESSLKEGVKNSDGATLFSNWCQFAKSHYLGLLVLDEVQNFFTIKGLTSRNEVERYRVADERALSEILTFLESSGIPTLFLGTPDAEVALNSRFAITSRLGVGGCMRLDRFLSPDDVGFKDQLMPELVKYQFEGSPLTNTEELRIELHRLTAGIKREIISLWRHAHDYAAELHEPLSIQHFAQATSIYLRHMLDLAPGIIENDPDALLAYEDLRALAKTT